MNSEQKKQLKSWGVDPKSIKVKFNISLEYLFLAMFLGILITIMFVQLEISPQWVTDQTCNNLSTQAFQYGYTKAVYDAANYTTLTGNFTYIYNNSIRTQGVEDYCLQLLNKNGGK